MWVRNKGERHLEGAKREGVCSQEGEWSTLVLAMTVREENLSLSRLGTKLMGFSEGAEGEKVHESA